MMNIPAYIRRAHRIIAVLWLLSLGLTFAVSAAGQELPGPSLPALFFIATIITGGYLLLRPWIRRTGSISDRLKRLRNWNVSRPAFVRRSHRLVATLWLLLVVLALAIQGASGFEPTLLLLPIVVLLLFLVLSGGYMFLRPWVKRFRA